jgi:succinate-semialdehyde dehydrogenase/glutarate-semialdehyde dehydrogenase
MLQSFDPYLQQSITCYATMSAAEVNECLDSSKKAFYNWSRSSLDDRLFLLEILQNILLAQREKLAQLATHEMGKLYAEALAEIDKSAALIGYYSACAQSQLAGRQFVVDGHQAGVLYRPLGPILGIMPWNFPFWQAFRFIVPALVAGNTALLKHASNVTGCALAISELFEQAGFPKGVFAVLRIKGSEMAGVITDQRIAGVSLTGSEAAGREVAAMAARSLKPQVLELGGSDPLLVFPDADLKQAVETAIESRFMNAGQSCIAAKRMLVHKDLYHDFREAFIEKMLDLKTGDPSHSSTTLAPMASAGFKAELEDQVQRSLKAGASLAYAADEKTSHPAILQPILLENVKSGMPAADDELFGPVGVLMKFTSTNEAIALANATRFGLGASVFTFNESLIDLLLNDLHCGSVVINGLMRSHPALPFGGIGDSGYGRELSSEGLLAFTNVKSYLKNKS